MGPVIDDEGATVGSHGWVSYQPIGMPDGEAGLEPAGDLRPRFADVGRLARRAVQGVVKAARAGEGGHSWAELLHEHLLGGVPRAGGWGMDVDLPVVDERWPGYEHVNVQSGLDA